MRLKKIILALVVFLILSVSLAGCMDEKSKFIGTWTLNNVGTMTFHENGTVLISNIGVVSFNGLMNYYIKDHNISFESRSSPVSLTVTLAYDFGDDSTLYLTPEQGATIQLKKRT